MVLGGEDGVCGGGAVVEGSGVGFHYAVVFGEGDFDGGLVGLNVKLARLRLALALALPGQKRRFEV